MFRRHTNAVGYLQAGCYVKEDYRMARRTASSTVDLAASNGWLT